MKEDDRRQEDTGGGRLGQPDADIQAAQEAVRTAWQGVLVPRRLESSKLAHVPAPASLQEMKLFDAGGFRRLPSTEREAIASEVVADSARFMELLCQDPALVSASYNADLFTGAAALAGDGPITEQEAVELAQSAWLAPAMALLCSEQFQGMGLEAACIRALVVGERMDPPTVRVLVQQACTALGLADLEQASGFLLAVVVAVRLNTVARLLQAIADMGVTASELAAELCSGPILGWWRRLRSAGPRTGHVGRGVLSSWAQLSEEASGRAPPAFFASQLSLDDVVTGDFERGFERQDRRDSDARASRSRSCDPERRDRSTRRSRSRDDRRHRPKGRSRGRRSRGHSWDSRSSPSRHGDDRSVSSKSRSPLYGRNTPPEALHRRSSSPSPTSSRTRPTAMQSWMPATR